MAPSYYTCDGCGRRVTDADLQSGDAWFESGELRCVRCAGMAGDVGSVDATVVIPNDAREVPEPARKTRKTSAMRRSGSGRRTSARHRQTGTIRRTSGRQPRERRPARRSGSVLAIGMLLVAVVVLAGFTLVFTDLGNRLGLDLSFVQGNRQALHVRERGAEEPDNAVDGGATGQNTGGDETSPRNGHATDGTEAERKRKEAERKRQEAERRKAQREAEALRALTQVDAYRESKPTDLKGLVMRFKQIAEAYPETKAGQKAAESRARLWDLFEAEAKREYKLLEIEATRLEKQADFVEAGEQFKRFSDAYRDTKWFAMAAEQVERYDALALAKARTVETHPLKIQHESNFEAGVPASWAEGRLEVDRVPEGSRRAMRGERVDEYRVGTRTYSDGYFAIDHDSIFCFRYYLSRPIPLVLDVQVWRQGRDIGRYSKVLDGGPVGTWEKRTVRLIELLQDGTEAGLGPGDQVVRYQLRPQLLGVAAPPAEDLVFMVDDIVVVARGLPPLFAP